MKYVYIVFNKNGEMVAIFKEKEVADYFAMWNGFDPSKKFPLL